MSSDRSQVLITCEHGGNRIPREYHHAFQNGKEVLSTHRGHDPGALKLAKLLAKKLEAPLEFETVSRLLIELNRTLGHPRVFSEFSRQLPEETRQQLIDTIYLPYRQRVIQHIRDLSSMGPVLHLSIHSFTPVMDGKVRKTGIGILFDPARSREKHFATAWRISLRKLIPSLAIHFNLPYRGTSDGFTTALRMKFPDSSYAGIEVEVNQKFPLEGGELWKMIQQLIVRSLQETLYREEAAGFESVSAPS